jgi:DNA polymerase-4
VVKLRLANFTTITRSRTLPEPTDVARKIHQTACELYAAAGLDRARLRLVGVRVTGLVPADSTATQLMLDERPTHWREAEQAIDKISHRFGTDAVRPAALVPGEIERLRRAEPPGRPPARSDPSLPQ